MFWGGRWEAGRGRCARSGLAPTTVLATNIGKERDLELLAFIHIASHNLNKLIAVWQSLVATLSRPPVSYLSGQSPIAMSEVQMQPAIQPFDIDLFFHDSLGLNGLLMQFDLHTVSRCTLHSLRLSHLPVSAVRAS